MAAGVPGRAALERFNSPSVPPPASREETRRERGGSGAVLRGQAQRCDGHTGHKARPARGAAVVSAKSLPSGCERYI